MFNPQPHSFMKLITDYLPRLIKALALAGLVFPLVSHAQPTAHYVPGIEGIKAATLPPPGVYFRDYNVAYFADHRNDANGNEADLDVFVYANVPRLIWITEWKVLGGFIGFDALIPLTYTDIEGFGSTFGIGDAFAEATWSAHTGPFDIGLGYGIWAPTGDFSSTNPTRAGSGFWTHMFTAGATYYFDAEKKWAISALNRYEINLEQDSTGRTPGDAWTIEGGLSYALRPTIDLGVVGYYQRQVTEDKHGSDDRDQVAGFGPEISAFCPKVGLFTSLRYLYELGAEDRLEGHTVTLTLTKRF